MKYIYILLGSILFFTACEDLDQAPPNIASANSLTDFDGVLNAAYYYQLGTVTPMAVMGDFRADNAYMFEAPYDEFDQFDSDLVQMEEQFFSPFYTACYKAILSCNIVIENSTSDNEIAEAKFLRALSYFKLVRVFGDVTINLSSSPSATDQSILARMPESEVYNTVIIPDLEEAIATLDNSGLSDGKATKIAAQAMLGKVYVHRGDFSAAEPILANVINDAPGAGISLQDDFANIFGFENDLNSEIIFATQVSSSINDEYGFSEFWSWSGGLDTKSLEPLTQDLIDAFDASPGDLRRAVTIDEALLRSPKFNQENGPDHDWIEIRLAEVILLYAEALNENGKTGEAVTQLNIVRARAGLSGSNASGQGSIRAAIQDERRLELAFEGHRWFDLVRTGTVDEEMGESINPNYYLFPIPDSEILSSFGVIEQNAGYNQ